MEFEKKFHWGHLLQLGAIFPNLGQLGVNVLVEFEKKFNWGHFFQIGGNGGKCVSGI